MPGLRAMCPECQAPVVRLVAECTTAAEAQARADFLEVKGISTSVREGASHELWVIEDDLLEQASELLENFDSSEDYSATAQGIRKQRERQARPAAPLRTGGRVRDGAGMVTILMIAASVLIALASKLGDTSTPLLRQLLVVPLFDVVEGGVSQTMAPVHLVWSEPWRLVTPMLIHFGLFHLAFNMMWLHLFGSQIEARHGGLWLVGIALVAQVLGSIAQFQLSGPLFGGMSGVNYALFGFVWMQSRYARRGYGIEGRDTVLLMGWLLLCATGLVGPVANACHAVGLAVGLLAGMPAYLGVLRNQELRTAFAKGSWADLNIQGWQRFERRFVQPFVPLWFMAIALLVLLLDA